MEREAVVDKYRSLRHELQALGDKISELEMDADEHQLVIAALEPLPPTRKCWRRVGGVLVEGDVASVLPILKTNIQGVFPI
jgi:prefoldin subunit 2